MTQYRRISAIDALRGFALAGIVEFNLVQMSGFARPGGAAADHVGAFVWESLFIQRFFPIFSFLFGVSFALFLRTASRRTDRPRLVLSRRLLWLGVFGALHTLLQHGEVLRFYAAFGLVVLLPASYLSRRWALALGLVLTLAGWVFLNGVAIIPGLFLLGLAAAGYGLADTLEQRTRPLVIALLVVVPVAVFLEWWQFRGGVGQAHIGRVVSAGTVVALLYALVFLLLLRTPPGRALEAVFAPMGRLALTNYVLASVLILAADRAFDLGGGTTYGPLVATGAGIGLVQAALSVLWLRWFRYGPLEWLWRCLTWWRRVPLRAEAPR
ncbi:DUF418 domain-containing protein [Cryptosporangium japonicum]|uniref:DUF418 domain-containing protein n=1 Tax=Cryptosporangium japonicum TaxID=80872 RepID=A0ABP3DIY5_9ACTN